MHGRIVTELDERPPFRPFRLADQVHPDFMGQVIGFPSITLNTGTNNILPSRYAALIPGNHMVQIKLTPIEDLSAILAGILVPLENVMPGKLDFFLRQPIENQKHDNGGDPDLKGNGVNHFLLGFALGELPPTLEVVSKEIALAIGMNHLGMPLE